MIPVKLRSIVLASEICRRLSRYLDRNRIRYSVAWSGYGYSQFDLLATDGQLGRVNDFLSHP